MNSIELMERCAKEFCGLETKELKRALYKFIAKSPKSYERLGEFLTEFANRGEYRFVYEFISETPLDLGLRSCKNLADMIEDMPYSPISSYGAYVKTRYEAYQRFYGQRLISMEEYSHELGIEKEKFKNDFSWSPAPGSSILFMPKTARL